MPAGTLLLLDTDVLVHLIRGSAEGERLDALHSLRTRADRPIISIVTVGEVLTFAERNGWGQSKRHRLNELLAELVIVPIHGYTIPGHYASITAFAQANGRVLSDNDRWIAATAVATGAELLTNDNDFDALDPTFIRLASRPAPGS